MLPIDKRTSTFIDMTFQRLFYEIVDLKHDGVLKKARQQIQKQVTNGAPPELLKAWDAFIDQALEARIP